MEKNHFVNQKNPACPGGGCNHLYKKKDFNQALGCLVILIGAIFVPITYGLSLVVVFLFDLLLYRRVKDSIECYKCRAEFKNVDVPKHLEDFDYLLVPNHHSLIRFQPHLPISVVNLHSVRLHHLKIRQVRWVMMLLTVCLVPMENLVPSLNRMDSQVSMRHSILQHRALDGERGLEIMCHQDRRALDGNSKVHPNSKDRNFLL